MPVVYILALVWACCGLMLVIGWACAPGEQGSGVAGSGGVDMNAMEVCLWLLLTLGAFCQQVLLPDTNRDLVEASLVLVDCKSAGSYLFIIY